VTLSGVVSIANTAQFNGESNIPCQVIGVEVCAVNHFGVGENLDCTKTDANGMRKKLFLTIGLLNDRSVLSLSRDGLECRDYGHTQQPHL
jgi:hypothetical protein